MAAALHRQKMFFLVDALRCVLGIMRGNIGCFLTRRLWAANRCLGKPYRTASYTTQIQKGIESRRNGIGYTSSERL